MNSYSLIVSPIAEDELEQAFNWYGQQKEGLGIEFLGEIKK